MNLLSELEGYSGEALTSAVLRFLILRSQEVREKFRDLVSQNSAQGQIVMHEEFSCRLEVPTKASEDRPDSGQTSSSGRIDLLLQTDNAIIGIENKLDASFQPGQPEKYREKLEQLAQSPRSNGKPRLYVLVILAPADRNEEIEKRIRDSKHRAHYILLKWETVLNSLESSVESNSDRISQTLVDQLGAYVLNSGRTFWPIELHASHLHGVFDRDGVHGEFIRKMKNIVPAASNIGSGQMYTGYHLQISRGLDSENTANTWFGFMKSELLVGAKHTSELVLATTKTTTSSSKHLRELEMKTPWWKPMKLSLWAIDFDNDEKWRKSDTWRDLISFLI